MNRLTGMAEGQEIWGRVVIGGHNLPTPSVEIGLTDLPAVFLGGAFIPPAPGSAIPGKWFCSAGKGQLISKCLFEKIVWTKIPTKNLIDSAQQV